MLKPLKGRRTNNIKISSSNSYAENKLEPSEHLDLLKLVKIVTGAEAAFIEAGTALAAIRDRKLYREETKTFEEFCQKHWGYNRAHAYRLICSVETVKMSPIGDTNQNRVTGQGA